MSPRKVLLTFGLVCALAASPVWADDTKTADGDLLGELIAWMVDSFGDGSSSNFGGSFQPNG
jgi:hypothetical protein